MRLLLHGVNFAPDPMGAGRYSGELASWLVKRGHLVRAVTTPSYQPDWRAIPGGRKSRAWAWRRERVGDVPVLRCPSYLPRRTRGASRFLHHASFALSSTPALIAESIAFKPNLVLSVTPAMLAAPAALMAARAARAPAWLHLQRFETGTVIPDDGTALDGMGNEPPFAQQAERAILKRFDMVSTPSEDLQDQLSDRGVPAPRQFLLPNWVDTRQVFPMHEPSALRATLGLRPDDFVALCVGPAGEEQAVAAMLQAASLVPDRGVITFVICGSDRAWTQIAQAGIRPRMRFLPLHHAASFNELMNLADVHLVWLSGDAAAPEVPPEFGTLLASGRPIIAAVPPGSTLGRIVEPVGPVVPPDDGAALAAAVVRLAADPLDRMRLGRAARQWALDYYEKERVLRRLESDLYGRLGHLFPAMRMAR